MCEIIGLAVRMRASIKTMSPGTYGQCRDLMAFTRAVGSKKCRSRRRVVAAIKTRRQRAHRRMLTLLRGQAEQKFGIPSVGPAHQAHAVRPPARRSRRGAPTRGVPLAGGGRDIAPSTSAGVVVVDDTGGRFRRRGINRGPPSG